MMARAPHVGVFCSASRRLDLRHLDVARAVGELLATRGCTLVYGGGDVGLMGVVARSAHAAGGRVVGVIPRALRFIEGVAYETADELVLTETMSERKGLIHERSDAFVVLPGGLGTLEEFLEVVTLRKLGYHDCPVFLVNPDGFFDKMLEFFEYLEAEQFMDAPEPDLFETVASAAALLETAWFRGLDRLSD